MYNVSIADKNFVKKASLTYELSILLGIDSFFYLIYDQFKNVLFLKEYELPTNGNRKAALQNILINDKQLQLPYGKIKLGHTGTLFCLIPNKLYNGEVSRPYLEKVCDLPSEHLAFVDRLSTLKVNNVYSISELDYNVLSSYFPMAGHYHILSALILGAKAMSILLEEQTLFINVDKKLIVILLFDKEKLTFANFFKFSNPNDFLFYVMLVFEQLGLDPETLSVQISGKIVQKSKEFELLYRYIRHVQLIPSPSYFHLSQEFSDINQHAYFDLFSLNLCE